MDVNQEMHVLLSHADPIRPEELIPILVPLASFGCTIAIVAIALYYRFRMQRAKHDLIKAYIDKGQEAPVALLDPRPNRRPNADLRRGLVLLAAGLSLAVAFVIGHEYDAIGVGLVPAAIGGAFLLVWKIESRERERDGSHG